jgi:predicted O-methyltransferase YrrM
MDAESVKLLATSQGRMALALASDQPDAAATTAAQRMRAHFPPALAAAALTQTQLRRRATVKFGRAAQSMFFTRDGLEQATRPEVAAHHAARFTAAGVRRVLDLGCGIGSDALAFAAAGLEVVCVEIDPGTAEIARLNLGGRAQVILGDADVLAAEMSSSYDGLFCDPGRRTTSGRLWRVEQFKPSWTLVGGLLSSGRVVGIKLGPALPHSLIPEATEAEWVSHRAETLEVGLWAGHGSQPGVRAALVLPDSRLVVPRDVPELGTARPGAYVYEPDGAVIRAGGVTTVGEMVHGALLDPRIAYLTSDTLVATPFAVVFEVLEVLPYRHKAVRRWLREHRVGTVEIKKRGVDVDPAQFRQRLGLTGGEQCTVILTRTRHGAVAIMARRLPGDQDLR